MQLLLLFPEGMENRWATSEETEWWWKPQLSWLWQRFETDCSCCSPLLHFGGPADHSEFSEEKALVFKQPRLKIQNPPTALQPLLILAHTCFYPNTALWIIIQPCEPKSLVTKVKADFEIWREPDLSAQWICNLINCFKSEE